MPSNANSARAWLVPFLFFFGGIFLLLALQEGCYQKGVKLSGVVLGKQYTPGTSRTGSGSLGTNSRHTVTYRFTTPQGEVKEDLGVVLLQNWRKLSVGDSVNLEYLPETGDSRVAGQTASATVFFAMGAAALAGGFFVRRSNRQKILDDPQNAMGAR